jgi:hypothetical protein
LRRICVRARVGGGWLLCINHELVRRGLRSAVALSVCARGGGQLLLGGWRERLHAALRALALASAGGEFELAGCVRALLAAQRRRVGRGVADNLVEESA